jgi:hypothetical protein
VDLRSAWRPVGHAPPGKAVAQAPRGIVIVGKVGGPAQRRAIDPRVEPVDRAALVANAERQPAVADRPVDRVAIPFARQLAVRGDEVERRIFGIAPAVGGEDPLAVRPRRGERGLAEQQDGTYRHHDSQHVTPLALRLQL